MIKLKPCPICGLEPEMEPWHGSGLNSTRIGCNADFCPVGVGVVRPSQRGAIKAWNTRPIEDALRAERDNFRAVLDGEGYQHLDKIAAETRDCTQIGAAAKARTLEIIAERDALRAEVERLREALAKYTEPLTDEQAERAFAIAKENGVGECDTLAHGVQGIDAAIRRVRRGE